MYHQRFQLNGRIGYNRLTGIVFAVLFMVVLLQVCPVSASERIRVRMTGSGASTMAEFYVNNRILVRLPRGNDGALFNKRVANWKSNLERVFAGSTSAASVKVVKVGNHAVIEAGGRQVIYIDTALANLIKSTPVTIAEGWASNIREALKATPTFSLSASSAAVPLNEDFRLSYSGTYSGSLKFFDYDGDLISVSEDRAQKRIIIRGLNLGSGRMKIQAGDITRTLSFAVRERAGFVPRYMNLRVSGSPASPWMVKNAFRSLARYASVPKDGTFMVIGNPLKGNFTGVKLGEKSLLTIPVKVDGEGYIPSIEQVQVTVENVGFPRSQPKLLFVSNNPEVVERDGDLFDGNLRGGEPIRYFYHHRNARHQATRNLHLALKNESSAPVTVFISPSGAGPTSDEIFAGHLALSGYFEYWRQRMGWFVTIRPGTTYVFETRQMKPNHTVSGIGYLNITEGSGLKMMCYASTVPGAVAPVGVAPESQKDVRISRGIFPAFIKLDSVHDIGGRFTFLFLGGEPYGSDVSTGDPNYGNYGAVYDIEVTVNNPWDDAREAMIYFNPGGGVARGIFEIDGVIIETPVVRTPDRFLLKRLTVPAGESSRVKILTIPQGGSYYPIRLVVESVFVKDP